MQRPSFLLYTFVSIGQGAHAFPLLFFFFGYFLTNPSFNIIPIIIIAAAHSGSVTFLGGNLYSIKSSLRAYYDFLLRFSGCKLTEQFINDLALENSNVKTNPIKIFHVSRNKDKSLPSPSSLNAYISDEYTPSYLFLTEPIDKMISGFQRFKLWHEIGHINQGGKDYENMINMLGLGWKSYFSILVCIVINLNLWAVSLNDNKTLLGLLLIILITFSILISNIKKREWLISELEADRFALIQILQTTPTELLNLYKKIMNKNFLYDKSVSEKENNLRRFVFLKQIEDINFDYPKGTWREMISASLNSISAIALVYIGTMSKRLDWVDILINFFILIVLPLLLTIILHFLRTLIISPVLDKALKAMEKGDFVQRPYWLDIMLPFIKFLNGDFNKKSKSSI